MGMWYCSERHLEHSRLVTVPCRFATILNLTERLGSHFWGRWTGCHKSRNYVPIDEKQFFECGKSSCRCHLQWQRHRFEVGIKDHGILYITRVLGGNICTYWMRTRISPRAAPRSEYYSGLILQILMRLLFFFGYVESSVPFFLFFLTALVHLLGYPGYYYISLLRDLWSCFFAIVLFFFRQENKKKPLKRGGLSWSKKGMFC